ncbi:MAG: metal-sensitive transcriptional regulator [Tepidiformaceae bacterium]
MTPEEERKVLARLARVEGQVRGLRKMLEEHRTCEDVLTQLLAARSGLEQAGLLVLEQHLEECILQGSTVSPEAMGQLRETLRLWSRHSAHD